MPDDKKLKFTLIKPADPSKGATREEYEAICRALGIEPKPPKTPAPEAASEGDAPPRAPTPPAADAPQGGDSSLGQEQHQTLDR